MTLFQYLSGITGYQEANGGEAKSGGGEGMDEDRMRALGIEGL